MRTMKNVERFLSKGWVGLGFADKTFWDWLNLFGVLAIPFVVFAVGNMISNQQHETDTQIAKSQQQETTLKTCLDDIKDLLLNKSLRASKPEDEVRAVARVEVLTTLRQLDGERKGILMQFLSEAKLITNSRNGATIDLSRDDLSGANLNNADLNRDDLSGANLNNADLSNANLNNADLSNANLSNADLSGAHLVTADLSGADLRGAKLRGDQLGCISTSLFTNHCTNLSGAHLVAADLSNADLSNADLSNADLSNADLSNANLSGLPRDRRTTSTLLQWWTEVFGQGGADLSNANLSRADLGGADLTQQQLDQVNTCKGAKNLPKGLTCHHNQ